MHRMRITEYMNDITLLYSKQTHQCILNRIAFSSPAASVPHASLSHPLSAASTRTFPNAVSPTRISSLLTATSDSHTPTTPTFQIPLPEELERVLLSRHAMQPRQLWMKRPLSAHAPVAAGSHTPLPVETADCPRTARKTPHSPSPAQPTLDETPR